MADQTEAGRIEAEEIVRLKEENAKLKSQMSDIESISSECVRSWWKSLSWHMEETDKQAKAIADELLDDVELPKKRSGWAKLIRIAFERGKDTGVRDFDRIIGEVRMVKNFHG